MKIDVKLEVEVPKVPNFIRIAGNKTISIADISTGGLEEIGRLWTEALIERAEEKRNPSK